MEAFPSSSSFGLLADYVTPTTTWTRHDDKIFEHALVMLPDDCPDRWINIADLVPGKSAADIRDRYHALVSDVLEIESGRVELPNYADDSGLSSPESEKGAERKKGKPWTKKEHQLFLLGLKKFGKGDWRSISRNVVITRTPTQVASHAQKYFLRQDSTSKDRKRSSIHDINTVEDSLITVAAVATGQRQLSHLFSITQPPLSLLSPSLPPPPPPPPRLPLPLPHQFAPPSYFPNRRSLLDY